MNVEEIFGAPSASSANDASAARLRFPPKLTKLEVIVVGAPVSESASQRLLQSICQLQALSTLTLHTNIARKSVSDELNAIDKEDSLSSGGHSISLLSSLPNLQDFSLFSANEMSEADVIHYCSQIKHFSTLQSLTLQSSWTVKSLQALCSPPHELQLLESISMRWTHLDAALLEQLLLLPGLSAIVPYLWKVGCGHPCGYAAVL